MLSRRRFLKMAGALGVVLLAPFDRLAQKLPSSSKGDPPRGELYEGFVLLEKDAPVPPFVQVAPCPIYGEIAPPCDNDPAMLAYKAETSRFDSIKDLRANVDFPIFVPGSLPHKMTFLQASVVRFAGSGEVWQARVDYGPEDTREPVISLTASPVFYRPYPVWPTVGYPKKREDERILDEEFSEIKPQKVGFTPRPGIMMPGDQGYMLQWIRRDVLYTMFMEHAGWCDTPERVGRQLVEQ